MAYRTYLNQSKHNIKKVEEEGEDAESEAASPQLQEIMSKWMFFCVTTRGHLLKSKSLELGRGWVRIGFKLVGQGRVSLKMCKAKSFRGRGEKE